MEYSNDDDLYGEISLPHNDFFDFFNNIILENNNKIINGFKEIRKAKISTKNNLYKEIEKETSKIYLYFIEKTEEFPKIFEKNFLSLEEAYNYLKSISIPNKCECAGIIDTVPGWRCVDCSKYENTILCSNCYLNSKHLHKNHRIQFLYSSGGMCDCGDPDSLYMYCPQHCGPYTDQKQIDEFINKSFSLKLLNNLKLFFDDFFMNFTKYLLLTEKCKYFYTEILEDNLKDTKEKDDVILLKNNFAIVFQNLINFLFKITENNLGMLHLISKYFLKNNLPEKIDEQCETTHSCIKIEKDNIEILYKDKNENEDILNTSSFFSFKRQKKHKCECPFLRLLFSNWRDNIKAYNKEDSQNEKFLLSFIHNLFLRTSTAIIIFFLYKEIILNNNNDDILYTRNQFLIEDITELIVKKTNLIEESYEFLYLYVKNIINSPKSRDIFGGFKPYIINRIKGKLLIYMGDCKYFTKPKVKELMYSKTSLLKRVIDISCLIHKQMEFKSIFPHPPFNEKKCVVELINIELFLIYIGNVLCLYINWSDEGIIKELFKYFIEKIIYLHNNKVLNKDEFSFHLLIYRIFSCFLNFFCFNYAMNKDTDINSAIMFIKNELFSSKEEKEELQNVINIILDDYYKMYGFIIGIRNEYFNYYDLGNYNFIYFNDKRELKQDYNLIKYLFAMTEKKINLEYILKTSNIEYVYSLFNNVFILNNNNNEEKNQENHEKIENKGISSYFKSIFKNIQDLKTKVFNLASYFKKGIKDGKDEEENKHVMQWKRILEVIISIMKNDTIHYWDILNYFDQAISIKTKDALFNSIKKNKSMMEDCRNMLKERLVQVFVANGNLLDLKGIKDGIDEFFFKIFKEQEFNTILEELTIKKMNGEKKEFYLKDSSLKFLDMNYYYSPMNRSKAELYIIDFKKDVFKMYNSYYYKPSKFTFDFYHKVYEKILLNIENIQLFIKIIDVLLKPVKEGDSKDFDLNSIRKAFLPTALNFLSMFACINSKSFIKFKIENENIINEIYDILNNSILYNNENENKLFDNELKENINEVIKQLNKYKIIREYINDDFNKLNDKDYNTDFKFEKNINNNNANKININETNNLEEDKKKNKTKDIKAHLKNLMKKKNDKFIKKASKNQDMKQIIETKISKEDKDNKEEENEMMCFSCRNPIILNNFDKPYGKLGLIFEDFFYANSFKSTLDSELNSILENNDKIKENIINILNNQNKIKEKSQRITSCGHYFHQSCFYKGIHYENKFKCPLCEKAQNILIPPLINFYENENILKSLKLSQILDKNIINKNDIAKDTDIFTDIITSFIKENMKLDLYDSLNSLNYTSFLYNYQSYMNFMINLFYSNGSTFHKQQQIEINQNLLLSLRYLTNINTIDINVEVDYIHNTINSLINGPTNKENCIDNMKNMVYSKYLDLLLFSFSILLDYKELKNAFIYLINWILPYMSFWVYIRQLIIQNNLYSLFDEKLKEKIGIEDLKIFLNEKNSMMNNYLKLYLQKLFIAKITTNYNNNKKDEINCNIQELSIKQLFSLLDMDTLYQTLSKNTNDEIIFTDLFEKIPKFFKSSNNCIINDYYEIFKLMIINTKNKNFQKILINNNLLVQFIPFKFKLIELDNKLFDWIEKCLFKKCCICSNNSKFYYICLICGKKICNTQLCKKISNHAYECGGGNGIAIYISDAKISLFNSYKNINKKENTLYPLYVNDSGVGPNGYEMEDEYYLSKEKYNLALKQFISNDFN